jgi:hypothetical protein
MNLKAELGISRAWSVLRGQALEPTRREMSNDDV